MRHYELMLVLRPDLEDAGVNQVVSLVTDTIEKHEGTVVGVGQLADKKGGVAKIGEDGWRTRRLAYVIDGCHDGYYAVIHFSSAPSLIDEIERQLNLRDDVLRHLAVRLDEAELLRATAGPSGDDEEQPARRRPRRDDEGGAAVAADEAEEADDSDDEADDSDDEADDSDDEADDLEDDEEDIVDDEDDE